MTSDESLRLKEQPDTITFIGGGYITWSWLTFLVALELKLI